MSARKFIKVNLLPKDAFEISFLGQFLKWSLTAGRVMVVLTEFVVILAFSSRFWFDKKLNDLRETNGYKQTTIQSYVATEEEMRLVLARQKVVESFLDNRLQISNGLDKLKLSLPSGAVLDQVNFVPGRVSIAGIAGSEQALIQTINAMKFYPNIKKVDIKRIEFNQKKGGVVFEIISHLGEDKK